MKKNLIYIICLSVSALFSACTDRTDDNPAVEPSQPGMLAIHARTSNGSEWYNFSAGDQIIVYNTGSNLPETQASSKGIYKYISNKWVNQPSDTYHGLWSDAIAKDEANGKYFFTATSNNQRNAVSLNQINGTKDDDFLVARATVDGSTNKDEAYWQEEGITLHFRHVLSQLKVNVYLPIGNDDGYFTPATSIKNVTMSLVTPRDQYTVTYDTSLKESEIASVTTNMNNASNNLNMHLLSSKVDGITAPGTTQAAKVYTFDAIIPDGQYYPKDKECLNITVNYNGTNYNFTYAPPSNTTMLFKQEKITVVNLTLLHQKPVNKVFLNSVKLQDWITDEADVDLIPEATN